MPLIKGQRYTWNDILEITGADGGAPYYLPHIGKMVVAACLTLDRDPDAPQVILAGNGPLIKMYADLFCSQTDAIPVCIKSGEKEWLCCGNYKLSRASTDATELASHSMKSQRNDIYKILYLQEI